jgi:hypothetical protein
MPFRRSWAIKRDVPTMFAAVELGPRSRSPRNFANSPLLVLDAPPGINDGQGAMVVSHVGKIHPSGFLLMRCGSSPATNFVHAYQIRPFFADSATPGGWRASAESANFEIYVVKAAHAHARCQENPFAEEPNCAYIPHMTME